MPRFRLLLTAHCPLDMTPDKVDEPSARLPPGGFYRLAWIIYLILALGGIVWIGLRLESIPLSVFLRPQTAALDVGLGLATGVGLIVVWNSIRRLMPSARQLEDELRRMLGPVDRGEIAGLALLSGLAEELFFRGAMQGALGWPIATLAFTLLHTGPGHVYRVWTLFAGIAGLAFAGLVVWRQALLSAIVAHVLVNLVNLRRLAASDNDSADS